MDTQLMYLGVADTDPDDSFGYAVFGARVVAGPARPQSVGWDAWRSGPDPDVLRELLTWKMLLLGRSENDGAETDYNYFECVEAGARSTKRKVLPPLRPGSNLPDGSTARIYNAFHMLANPKSAELHIKELNEFLSLHKDHKKPLLVWEADPDFCDPQNRAKHLEACKLFDVFCIGSRELMSMFDAESESRQSFDLSMVGFAKQFLEAGSANPDDGPSEPGEGPHEASEDSSDSGNGIKIVVPAGKYGCLIMWKADKWRWLEPWYKAGSDQIIDATGTNNAFVGAFTVSMQRGDNFIEAACCGIIAASFAIQQDGLPSVDWVDGVEMWNGENFVARLQKYREELNKHMLNRDL